MTIHGVTVRADGGEPGCGATLIVLAVEADKDFRKNASCLICPRCDGPTLA